MAQSIGVIQLLGPVKILVATVDIGHTDEAGAKITVPQNVILAKTAKFGQTPVKGFLNGRESTVEFLLNQTEKERLETLIPGATKVSSGGNDKLTFGQTAGKVIPAVKLELIPEITGNTPQFNWTFFQVIPIGEFEQVLSGEDYNKWSIKFMVLANEAGGVEGDYEFSFGDDTISADVTAPSVTAVLPVDNEGAAAKNTNVVATLSEDMDGTLVNADNVKLIEDLTGTPVEIAGAVTLVNAGASTTITFNPDSDLAGTTEYTFMLSNLKDKAGNDLPFFESDFTTVA